MTSALDLALQRVDENRARAAFVDRHRVAASGGVVRCHGGDAVEIRGVHAEAAQRVRHADAFAQVEDEAEEGVEALEVEAVGGDRVLGLAGAFEVPDEALEGGEEAWAEQLQASTGGALSLVEEQSDVVPWYQGLSVLVHPSFTEGFSLVHLEALATGCCVVASRLPYLPGLIEHGRTGFLFEPGDVKGLREILDMLMAEPERAHSVGRNAAEEARRRFGIEHEARALADLYEALL